MEEVSSPVGGLWPLPTVKVISVAQALSPQGALQILENHCACRDQPWRALLGCLMEDTFRLSERLLLMLVKLQKLRLLLLEGALGSEAAVYALVE